MVRAVRGWVGMLLLVLAAGSLAACDGLTSWLANAYEGPYPAETDISGETVIVRRVFTTSSGEPYGFYADRVSFLETRPHDINRMVQVEFEALPAAPRVGDVLRISTRFQGISEASGLQVPDWPYDRYFEYPIARHALTSAEPAP